MRKVMWDVEKATHGAVANSGIERDATPNELAVAVCKGDEVARSASTGAWRGIVVLDYAERADGTRIQGCVTVVVTHAADDAAIGREKVWPLRGMVVLKRHAKPLYVQDYDGKWVKA